MTEMINCNIIICLSAVGRTMNFSEQIFGMEVYSSCDIVKKCKKYPEFKRELQELQVAYSHDLNMAIYASLEDIEQMEVFQVSNRGSLTISFYAYLMPPFEQYSSSFYLYWIKLLDELLRLNVGRTYTIIYYHSLCESNYPYNFLIGIYKKLPIYYYAMLDKIYTVEANFFLRKSAGLLEFGRLYKLFERKMENIEKLSELAKLDVVVKGNLLQSLPQKLMIEVQQKTKKKMMKEQQKGNFNPMPRTLSYQPIYQPSSQKKVDCLNMELANHKLDPEGVPVPLAILVNTLRANTNFLDLQGIFRKSGSIEEEEQIIIELSKLGAGDQLKNIADYSGFAIAGVVKKFFTKLTTPVVPYAVYNDILALIGKYKIEDELSFVLDFINQLPQLNRKVTIYLLNFLKREVISRQDSNKMNNYNMSVCFCPCIFRSETPTLADLLNSGKFASILNIIFAHFEEVEGAQERGSKDKEKGEWQGVDKLKAYRISTA